MKRRSFVKKSLLTSSVTLMTAGSSFALTTPSKSIDRQYYELRVYCLKDSVQQHLVEDYFHHAFIPALNKIGIGTVGVFIEVKPENQTKLLILIPYENLEEFSGLNEKLEKDETYLKHAESYLNAPPSAPAFQRIESSLIRAFTHMPSMNIPASKSRIFELRQYQSASEAAGKKKISMFNDIGEIEIFKRLGFNPVFFGETIIGNSRPNLTYMVTFEDMAAHDTCWKSFIADSEWKKISAIPEYADALLVSKITSTLIKPLPFSQI